jgi:CheY-like chemotaxis protein/DNA-directed RNA polymerase subunit RPC12/RpoP
MQSTIQIRCPGCNARIKAPSQLLGQMRDCPRCGGRLLIQRPVPEDAGPLMLEDESLPLDAPAETPAVQEKVILLVDDDRELNDGLGSLLEKQGHRVLQAFDGIQAKEMVEQQRLDLMILDMMMPKLGGYPVLEYFHNRSGTPPIIMMTAKEGAQHKVYAEYLGVIDYLNKPFAIERLLKSVEKGLGLGQDDRSEIEAR